MKKHKAIITYSNSELQTLEKSEHTCVHKEKKRLHLTLLPFHLTDLEASITEILSSNITKHNRDLQGILLGYKNVKVVDSAPAIYNDNCLLHLDIEANFYLFKPIEGETVIGLVNQVSDDHIGCLVHKAFNVVVPKTENEEWCGNSIKKGQQILVKIVYTNLEAKLPYIKADFISAISDIDSGISTGEENHLDFDDPIQESPKKGKYSLESTFSDEKCSGKGKEERTEHVVGDEVDTFTESPKKKHKKGHKRKNDDHDEDQNNEQSRKKRKTNVDLEIEDILSKYQNSSLEEEIKSQKSQEDESRGSSDIGKSSAALDGLLKEGDRETERKNENDFSDRELQETKHRKVKKKRKQEKPSVEENDVSITDIGKRSAALDGLLEEGDAETERKTENDFSDRELQETKHRKAKKKRKQEKSNAEENDVNISEIPAGDATHSEFINTTHKRNKKKNKERYLRENQDDYSMTADTTNKQFEVDERNSSKAIYTEYFPRTKQKRSKKRNSDPEQIGDISEKRSTSPKIKVLEHIIFKPQNDLGIPFQSDGITDNKSEFSITKINCIKQCSFQNSLDGTPVKKKKKNRYSDSNGDEDISKRSNELSMIAEPVVLASEVLHKKLKKSKSKSKSETSDILENIREDTAQNHPKSKDVRSSDKEDMDLDKIKQPALAHILSECNEVTPPPISAHSKKKIRKSKEATSDEILGTLKQETRKPSVQKDFKVEKAKHDERTANADLDEIKHAALAQALLNIGESDDSMREKVSKKKKKKSNIEDLKSAAMARILGNLSDVESNDKHIKKKKKKKNKEDLEDMKEMAMRNALLHLADPEDGKEEIKKDFKGQTKEQFVYHKKKKKHHKQKSSERDESTIGAETDQLNQSSEIGSVQKKEKKKKQKDR